MTPGSGTSANMAEEDFGRLATAAYTIMTVLSQASVQQLPTEAVDS